ESQGESPPMIHSTHPPSAETGEASTSTASIGSIRRRMGRALLPPIVSKPDFQRGYTFARDGGRARPVRAGPEAPMPQLRRRPGDGAVVRDPPGVPTVSPAARPWRGGSFPGRDRVQHDLRGGRLRPGPGRGAALDLSEPAVERPLLRWDRGHDRGPDLLLSVLEALLARLRPRVPAAPAGGLRAPPRCLSRPH